ncbi:RNA polymerase sigma factor [Desulfonema magnum]|uniref:RNA polymerase sigma factor, sigma-70 family n=1 Tax=Desulfonema magnum TaxID=45655 RepID=A0A975BHI0_9BACT|nr:sigma-70 family RNA polymerase sigma factor [Desulfonema magnum]QTA85546.1 RNA polymerase sigma factor, sigma-70 family [Desulfonema magnum]
MKKKLTPEEEREILHECIHHKKCEKLTRQYWNLIYKTVQKTFIFKNAPLVREELEEVQQDVFVQLFDDDCRRLRQYREGGGCNLAGWIILISNRTALNHLRGKDPHSIVARQYLTLFEDMKQELDMKKEVNRLEAREKLLKIVEASEKLPSVERLVFKLHYVYEFSLQDVASYMKREIGNIYTIKSRAIKRLKKLVED